MKTNYRELLLNQGKAVVVWGCGYIGYSTMVNYAINGVKCVGVDVDKDKVNIINSGRMPIQNFEYWLGFDTKYLVQSKLVRATTDWEEAINKDCPVHFIAIPTEKEAEPYDDILINVFKKLASSKDIRSDVKRLVIIESTLTPGKIDSVVIPLLEKFGLIVGKDMLLGVAPRRDWFVSTEKSLKTLPRIIGGTTLETMQYMEDVLSIICDNLIHASDHKHAELVKSIENAFRHVDITLANQLSLAYPDINMREVLRLVGTKWNIGTYQPSFGTGGYCIPLSSKYVLLGAQNPEVLTIMSDAIKTDSNLSEIVALSLVKRNVKSVGVLGLAYKGDIKVHVLSPTIKFVKALKDSGIAVRVNDPYYTSHEIYEILGVPSFDYPDGLKEFDAIAIITDHRLYNSTPQSVILNNLSNCKIILNNTNIWQNINFKDYGIEYKIAGSNRWLG